MQTTGSPPGRAPRSGYSPAEQRSDAVVHLLGLALLPVLLPLLIWLTAQAHDRPEVLWGVGIYAATLAAMLGASALYNMTRGSTLGWLWRRLDHSAIYVKIAGTYTPFALITGQGVALTLGLWGAAVLGVALKLVSPERFRWMALALYLGMGWAGVVAGQAMIAALSGGTLALMLAGGITYTVGVTFYLWKALPFHITIWHGFVLVASLLFYAAVVALVLVG